MKITKITVQKKNKSRYNVFVDRGNGEEFGFAIDEDVYIKSGIQKGMELTAKDVSELEAEDEVRKGFNLAVNYLSYRMRSYKEIVDYLKKKEVPAVAIEAIMERLQGFNYIDDLEFAKMFIRSKVATSQKGPKALVQELKLKGVPQTIIEEAIPVYPQEEQIESATKLAIKKAKQSQKLSEVAVKQKVGQILQQKGFAWNIIEQALEKASLEKNEDEEREALDIQAQKANRKYSKFSGREYKQKMKQYLYRKGFPLELIDEWLNNNELNDQ
ncbi:recombination regulator RecX [Pseudalkalibacillus decolorationis]|uniref:recombination regulator RecX n=1 Tax=Pseudalkalibacillus decolorationis TaxID=163879 RepID=UPI0021489C78|nr:recombination regulator RecX [Pseudalkalibacillus decolorationis]